MSLSIENEKVRVATEDGLTWYEFGLETGEDGRVYHSDLMLVADPGDYDGEIVLSYGGENFRTYAITHEGRGYLETDQVATADPENGPVSLKVDGDGDALLLELVQGEDGRKYLNYRSAYIVGQLRGKLGAVFEVQKFDAVFEVQKFDAVFDLEMA